MSNRQLLLLELSLLLETNSDDLEYLIAKALSEGTIGAKYRKEIEEASSTAFEGTRLKSSTEVYNLVEFLKGKDYYE